MIEKGNILADHASGMALAEDYDVVQAFAANRTEEALTHGIGFRGLKRCLEQFSVNADDRTFKQQPVFVIVIANQEARTDTEGSCLTDLLSHPSITGGARHGEVNHSA